MVKEAFVHDVISFKKKALYWASSFNMACVLDSNNFSDPYSKFDFLVAADAEDQLKTNFGTAFTDLKSFKKKHVEKWMTGFLGYDLKNETENLVSENDDALHFPDLCFFVPKHVILIKNGKAKIWSEQPEHVLNWIEKTEINQPNKKTNISIRAKLSKKEYLQKAEQIRQHILRGDVYETNFCQEFYAENVQIDPASIFDQLNVVSPTPFACYFKAENNYILSASPERFLAKINRKLISQPIKGTSPRKLSSSENELQKNMLKNSIKEQSENVMIVDLVRNDLTKIAVPGSVKVEELFEIYSFSQVNQMISTVSAELGNGVDVVDAIKNTFPAGSMTGAPKLRSMQLMEQFEASKRSIYAGSVGYFSPEDDFDFNVVIRSVLYNQEKKYLSFQVGSALTFLADSEAEYQECLLKASAILQVLQG